jgi:hypothetical protein
MAALPEYVLVGTPYKLACHHKPSRNYYQAYRLDGRLLKAPCCADKQTANRKTIAYVEAHIRKHLTKTDPVAIHASTTIVEHLKVYEASLTADKCNEKYVKMAMARIKRLSKALGFKRIKDVDGLRLKTWVAKQSCALKTARDNLAGFKALMRFLFLNNRIETDPLARTTLAIKGDLLKRTTRKRRCITPAEFAKLLVAAKNGKETHGLTGEQRRMLYLCSASTGFRAQECSSLSPRSFSLDDDRPVVILDCRISKRRRHDVQELRKDVAEEFRRWIADKPADEPLWGGWWWSHASDMLQVDLKTAGIEFKTEAGVIDFHAVGRVHFITRLVATSAPLPLVQRVARLSSAHLLDRYYRPADQDRRDVVESMPSVLAEVAT